jgi:hypothetical protein
VTTNSGVRSGATTCLCVVFRTERNGTAVAATQITGLSEGSGPKWYLLTALVWPPPATKSFIAKELFLSCFFCYIENTVLIPLITSLPLTHVTDRETTCRMSRSVLQLGILKHVS